MNPRNLGDQMVQRSEGNVRVRSVPRRVVGGKGGQRGVAHQKDVEILGEIFVPGAGFRIAHVRAITGQQDVADAVVFDSPVLLYYAANDGKGKVQVVGSIFRKENYGIVVPANSPLRKRIDAA